MESVQWNFHSYLNLFRGVLKVMEEDWQKAANELGVTQAEQHILWIIYIEGQATMSQVADLGLWDLSTVMQIMKRLREKKLIEVEKNDSDLRVSYVSLTEKGEETRKASAERHHRLFDFLAVYAEKESDSEAMLESFHDFLKEANLYFHGREFVDWVGKTRSSETT
ncbi:MarR family winged helix-turn-helix transcriptional regulator [Salibacterium aidingense]|uniref:MarR family winged helix-turn-helix transcriptional regulator n=1 Tax=Salibacterium aidingense TaxID=384933 RepID=UPI000402EBAA|nr:MarR family transcriptional regulator [Salibacterium aidingense]